MLSVPREYSAILGPFSQYTGFPAQRKQGNRDI